MTYKFNGKLATECGLNAAVIYEYIWMGCHDSYYDPSEKYFKNGLYWFRSSIKKMHNDLPFLSEKQIRNALEKLRANHLILEDCLNNDKRDVTKWYTIIGRNSEAINDIQSKQD